MLFVVGREMMNGHAVYRVLNIDIHNGIMNTERASVIITDVYSIFQMIQQRNQRGEYNLLQNAAIIMRGTTRRLKYTLMFDDKSKSFYFEGIDGDTKQRVRKSLNAVGTIRPEALELEGGVYGSILNFKGYASKELVYTIIAEYHVNGKREGYCLVDQRCGGNIGYNQAVPAQLNLLQEVRVISSIRPLYRQIKTGQRMSDIFTNAEVHENNGTLQISPKKKHSETEGFIHVTGQGNPNTQTVAQNSVGHYDCNEWRVVTLDGKTMRNSFKPGEDRKTFEILRNYHVEELLIPQGVTDLSGLCDMQHLKRVSIPSSVGTIQAGTCFNCPSLEHVVIGSGVTGISPEAFINCPNIKMYDVHKDSKYYATENGVIFSKDKKSLVRFPTNYKESSINIPPHIKTICDGAFRNCKIARVNIPQTVEAVGSGAFFGSTLIEAWVAATYVLEESFCNCPNLRSLRLHMGVRRVRGAIISNNHCIRTIVFPDSLEQVAPFKYNARIDGQWQKDINQTGNYLIGANTSVAVICLPAGKPALKYVSQAYDGVGHVQLYDNSVETLTRGQIKNPQQYHGNF